MNITKVLGSRVLVKVIVEEVPESEGLVVAPQSVNPSYFKGEVVKMGPSTALKSEFTLGLKIGDKVVFTKYGYEDMGDGQYLVEENALLAVYE